MQRKTGRILTIVTTAAVWLIGGGCAKADIPVYGYTVRNVFPHDENAFTQGLVYRDGYLYESTGQYGSSSVRRVELETGTVKHIRRLEGRYFGEGLVAIEDELVMLTWRAGTGFVFGIDDLFERRTFSYAGQGWGLTSDGARLVMSDGSDRLRFLDPDSFAEQGSVSVTMNGRRVARLNELEWVDGEVLSNVWQTDWVLRIDAETGAVTGLIDLSNLLPAEDRRPGHTDVLNGIAYDSENRRLFVTGKNWPKLFEIELVEREVVPNP